jgi:hypothetical protein
VEFRPRQEGNTLHAILAPKKAEAQKKPAQPKPQQPAPPQQPPAPRANQA